MNHAIQDLRFAARQLARQPTFALLFIVTLALGIGAATTCFSVLNAVALRPIPFPEPDRLVAINLVGPQGSFRAPLTLNGLRALTETQGVFSGYAGYVPGTVTVAAGGTADRVPSAEISGDIFSVLGVPVQIGRSIVAADAGSRVAVVGNDYALRVFGSDGAALGKTILVNGEQHAVVGVARPRFSFPEDARVWLPLALTTPDRSVVVVARIQPGVSAAQADAVARAALAAATARPTTETADWTAATAPLREIMMGTKQRDMALFILVASGLVLLIACANLAGLLTSHLGARKHEIAVRAAIGARRVRIVQQLMTESVMLALAGGSLGVLLAQWGVAVFAATLGKPRGADWIDITVDSRVLLFALLVSTLTALLFGLAPAIRGSRADLRDALQEDRGAAGAQPRGHRVRYILVAGQVALSIGLVSGAAAIVTSSMRFGSLDTGFNRDRLLVSRVALENRAYDHPEQRLAFVDSVLGRLRSLPGVASASVASHVPLADRDVPGAGFILDGTATPERPPRASLRFIDADYLGTMAIPVDRGRAFTAAEARDRRPRTAIINDTMARRHWPDRDPVGARLRLLGGPEVAGWYTIVGVAGDVAQRQLPAEPEDQIYLPLSPAREMTFVVRSASDPAPLATSARDAVRAVDPSLAVETRTMAAAYAFYVNDRRLQGLVLGTIGAIAVLIAALGVYGAVSLMVTERRRELAIRTALGASRRAVMRLVLARGLSLATVGVGAGLLLAIGLTALLSSIFLGVRAFDVRVLGSTAAVLACVALAASWWPARRAMRIDPIIALKE